MPRVGQWLVVTLCCEAGGGVAADDAVNDLGAGTELAARDAVGDDVTDGIVRVASYDDEITRAVGAVHAVAVHVDIGDTAAERLRPDEPPTHPDHGDAEHVAEQADPTWALAVLIGRHRGRLRIGQWWWSGQRYRRSCARRCRSSRDRACRLRGCLR